ncbi:DUF4974 domain-containing protein [Carboxylicivirga sp. A043]|uniref:FecR family protein n=1 Tax=Carboxylicivirga litoralis TaxID=2816963 RepID=UPI0021CB128B|nr:FecR domain-containing protein [Carboxylicivirga sp. A043]MCU4156190.1 DUF4974 domain-containing protein [Carboxylicivirga sp. A043]
MNKKLIWELITKQLPPDKESELWEQIQASPEWLSQYKNMKRIWSLSDSYRALPQKDVEAKYKEFKQSYQRKEAKKSWILPILKYAAILIIAFISSYSLWMFNNSQSSNYVAVNHYETGKGSVNTILLSDGSQIWLNANSSIDINKAESNYIELRLSGEALFDIVHNDNRRFIVNVNQLKIEDLGTRFNIRSFEKDKEVIATLIEGEIEISDTQHQFTEHLLPGQQMQYSTIDGRYTIASIDTTYVGTWKDSKFEFVNKSLEDIAHDLENWYGVHITFKNKKIAQERFTGVIQKSTNIDKVLEVIAYSAGIKYSINKINNQTEIMIQ